MICFQNSGNVENNHLNCACHCCAQHDDTIFINWNSKAVYDKACVKYAIFHVKEASQQRVIISIITLNIMYTPKIFRYVLLSYCTLLRILQNSNKAKKNWYKFKKHESVI